MTALLTPWIEFPAHSLGRRHLGGAWWCCSVEIMKLRTGETKAAAVHRVEYQTGESYRVRALHRYSDYFFFFFLIN